MTIERLHSGDVKALSDFAAEMFSDTFAHLYQPQDLAFHLEATCSALYFIRELERNDVRIDVIKQDGKIVAYAKYGALALPVKEPLNPNCEIHRLYVHPAQKRSGLGHQFMLHIQAYAESMKARSIYLGVYSDNHIAQAFYHRFGFEKVGEYDYPVGAHIDHEFIFMKALAEV